jgi:hypothetical protein
LLGSHAVSAQVSLSRFGLTAGQEQADGCPRQLSLLWGHSRPACRTRKQVCVNHAGLHSHPAPQVVSPMAPIGGIMALHHPALGADRAKRPRTEKVRCHGTPQIRIRLP